MGAVLDAAAAGVLMLASFASLGEVPGHRERSAHSVGSCEKDPEVFGLLLADEDELRFCSTFNLRLALSPGS